MPKLPSTQPKGTSGQFYCCYNGSPIFREDFEELARRFSSVWQADWVWEEDWGTDEEDPYLRHDDLLGSRSRLRRTFVPTCPCSCSSQEPWCSTTTSQRTKRGIKRTRRRAERRMARAVIQEDL